MLEKRLDDIAHACATAHSCIVEFDYLRRYPSLINTVDETELAVCAAIETVGEERVNSELKTLSGSEDFFFMLNKVPGAYILVGNGREGDYCANVPPPI